MACASLKLEVSMRMVYFVRGSVTGLIKIGSAINPKRRVKAMQTGSGETLELLSMIPEDGQLSEATLHVALADSRVHGEWFKMTDRLQSIIASGSLTSIDTRIVLPVGSRIRTPGVLGSVIKAYRMKRGLSQKALAAGMNVSRQWIVEIERGKIRAELGLVFMAIQYLDIPLGIV